MAQVELDVGYTEPRNRLTNGLRFIWAIPHQILMAVWQYAVQAAALIQWFVILFTALLMTDTYPKYE